MGNIFKVPAMIIYFIGGLWGLFLCLGIIYDKLGLIATILSFFVLPFTLYLAPWYVAIADGNWHPVMVIYGATVVAFLLAFIGSLIDGN